MIKKKTLKFDVATEQSDTELFSKGLREIKRQEELLQEIKETIAILKLYGYDFWEVLQGFADYAEREKEEGSPDKNQRLTWDRVISLLRKTASIASHFVPPKLPIPANPTITTITLGHSLDRERRESLVRVLRDYVALQEDNCHFSHILGALAEYAEQQKNLHPLEVATIWKTLASFLKTASAEAETRGRELP